MASLSNRKNFGLTLCSGFGVHFVTLLINLISVPISLNYWGNERYGLFAIINSILVYLSISSLGLNSAASILMAKNAGFDNKILILKRSFLMLVASILIFLLIFILINGVSSKWIYLLGDVPARLFSETFDAMMVMVCFFFLNSIFSHIDSVFNGFQRLYMQKAFDMFYVFLSFLSLLLTIGIKGSLAQFVFLNGLARLVVSFIKAFYFFNWIKPEEKLKANEMLNVCDYSNSEEVSFKFIMQTGIKMVLVGVAAMVVWHSDNLVISHYLGIERVTPYSVSFRIFSAFFSLIIVFNGAILPLIAREFSVKNWQWINKISDTFLKLMAMIGGLFWLCGILFLKDVIVLWAGINGFAGVNVLIALGGYAYLISMANLNSGLAISMNYVDQVVFVGWVEACVKLFTSILLLKYLDLAGLASGTFLGSLIGPVIILPLLVERKSGYMIKQDYAFVLRHFFLILLPCLLLAIFVQMGTESFVYKAFAGSSVILIYLGISVWFLPLETRSYLTNMLPRNFWKQTGFRGSV